MKTPHVFLQLTFFYHHDALRERTLKHQIKLRRTLKNVERNMRIACIEEGINRVSVQQLTFENAF